MVDSMLICCVRWTWRSSPEEHSQTWRAPTRPSAYWRAKCRRTGRSSWLWGFTNHTFPSGYHRWSPHPHELTLDRQKAQLDDYAEPWMRLYVEPWSSLFGSLVFARILGENFLKCPIKSRSILPHCRSVCGRSTVAAAPALSVCGWSRSSCHVCTLQ